jgi:hypothetical protein
MSLYLIKFESEDKESLGKDVFGLAVPSSSSSMIIISNSLSCVL